jgi:hypothetical protein
LAPAESFAVVPDVSSNFQCPTSPVVMSAFAKENAEKKNAIVKNVIVVIFNLFCVLVIGVCLFFDVFVFVIWDFYFCPHFSA